MGGGKVADIHERVKGNGSRQYEVAVPARSLHIRMPNESALLTDSFRIADTKKEDPETTAATSTMRAAFACRHFTHRRMLRTMKASDAVQQGANLIPRRNRLPQACARVIDDDAYAAAPRVRLHRVNGRQQAATHLSMKNEPSALLSRNWL